MYATEQDDPTLCKFPKQTDPPLHVVRCHDLITWAGIPDNTRRYWNTELYNTHLNMLVKLTAAVTGQQAVLFVQYLHSHLN